ncbi:DUF3737 family protein [Lachnospira pectinoschiza]|uniref:DUF3737 domain-containing protein n=1 Tax=Lachnospira pectinoschiza TaxID=28052 RepID=A0A1G9T5Y2_9FIRM|nr:DUF3737 family protein [Lachnospira pectinoschiza]SDM43010.1 Protein of unknown function [Lachnospira pectinoschiza]
MVTIIENQSFDEERALYGVKDTTVSNCKFEGPADGESALKEARDICIDKTSFSLRYPLWHVDGFKMLDSTMDDKTRAAIWYAKNGEITNSKLGGIKAVRECSNITVKDSTVESQEFGWKSDKITLDGVDITSEYIFLDSSNLKLNKVNMKGKYSFQYVKNMEITDSNLDTKDAFWHSENVTVKNSVVKGEYLGWYSKGLTLINCKIIGTQPLCYCENLTLIDCTMEGTDLSFEYSDVNATVTGNIESVKNPKSGKIVADSIGEIIREDAVIECNAEVVTR